MGEFKHTMQVSGLNGGPSVEVEGLVDTGASFSFLPGSVLRRLGIAPHREVLFEMGDKRIVTYDVGRAMFTIDGRSEVAPVAFDADDSEPVIGVLTLEALRLLVDPLDGRLIPRETLRR